MVGKKKKSKKYLGNHQKCWLWGRHAVLESLRGARWLPLEVHVDPYFIDRALQEEIETLASAHEVPLFTSTAERMTQLCGSKEHQGLMARMPEYAYAALEPLLEQLSEAPLLLILDRIQDPYNFGSILRSAEQFGVEGIVIGMHGQSPVSSHVARSSAGAVNFLKIAQVASLTDAAQQLKAKGIRLLAASEKGTHSVSNENLCGPTAIVIGNEGEGVELSLLKQCDQLITIPQSGNLDSLNAAVATGILCYEAQRQRSTSVAT